jgi:hypothetical protein
VMPRGARHPHGAPGDTGSVRIVTGFRAPRPRPHVGGTRALAAPTG